MLPDIFFNNYFQKRSDIHYHNTINCHQLHVPRARTNLNKQPLKLRRADYYNELSAIIITKTYIKVLHQSIIKPYHPGISD